MYFVFFFFFFYLHCRLLGWGLDGQFANAVQRWRFIDALQEGLLELHVTLFTSLQVIAQTNIRKSLIPTFSCTVTE